MANHDIFGGSVEFVLDSYSDSNLKLVWEKDPVLKYILRTVPQSVSYIKSIIESGDGVKELYQELQRVAANHAHDQNHKERIPEVLKRLLNCNQEQLLGSLIYSRYDKLGKLASLNAQLLMQQSSKPKSSSVNAQLLIQQSASPYQNTNQSCCQNVNVNLGYSADPYMNVKSSLSNSCTKSYVSSGTGERFHIDHNLNMNMITTLNARTIANAKLEKKKDFKCHKCSNDAVVSAFDPLCDKTNLTVPENPRTVCNCNCGTRMSFRVKNKHLVLASVKPCGSNPDLIWFSPAKNQSKSFS